VDALATDTPGPAGQDGAPGGEPACPAGIDELFVAILPQLQRGLQHIASGAEEADDVLQELYLRLRCGKAGQRFLLHPNPVGYSAVIVRNLLRDRWRQRRRNQDLLARMARSEDLLWDGGLRLREAELEVVRELRRLSDRQATVLGVHRGSVHRSRVRALENLRSRIADRQAPVRRPDSDPHPAQPSAADPMVPTADPTRSPDSDRTLLLVTPEGTDNVTDTLAPAPEDWRRGLVVVAHPDDVEYSGAIAEWTTAGRELSYLIATRGEAGISTLPPAEAAVVREEEQRKSAAIVGVTLIEYLDHQDGVIHDSLTLRHGIAAAIRRNRPEVIVTLNYHERFGSGVWNSADHRTVGLAALDAVLDAGNRWIFPELAAAGLEPWGGVRYVFIASSPRATHAVDISRTIDLAVASLSEHRVYLEALGPDNPMSDPGAVLRGKAGRIGARFGGATAAAAFEVIPFGP
jgi:LmbE family N-acetylglucosaminyl deacetylase